MVTTSTMVIVLALTGAAANAIIGVLAVVALLVVVVALADSDAPCALRRVTLWVRDHACRLPGSRS
jgi:hypothetical protein